MPDLPLTGGCQITLGLNDKKTGRQADHKLPLLGIQPALGKGNRVRGKRRPLTIRIHTPDDRLYLDDGLLFCAHERSLILAPFD